MNITQVWTQILNWLVQTFQQIPSGSSSAEVQGYYNYLYQVRFEDMPRHRATELLLSSQVDIFAWGASRSWSFSSTPTSSTARTVNTANFTARPVLPMPY